MMGLRTRLGRLRTTCALAAAFTMFAGGSIALADGTETLGVPSVPIAAGSGTSIGGTGLRDLMSAPFDVNVPADASVSQVLLYWEGFALQEATGFDDTAVINGTEVTGTLIGGPTLFFPNAWSSTYRADITALGLVGPGSNTLTVSGVNFSRISNGVGVTVIWDDGTTNDIQLVDGSDLAFVTFASPLDTTVPQTFTFAATTYDRVASLDIHASSVKGEDLSGNRPNLIEVTVDGLVTRFIDELGSNNGEEWDAVSLPVSIPAGATTMTVQLLSEDGNDPSTGNLPASLNWLVGAATIPLPAELGDFVWSDNNENGIQDPGEPGVPGVEVRLRDCAGVVLSTTTTDSEGEYLFTGLEPDGYSVQFIAPDGTAFTLQGAGGDDGLDSNADASGVTGCVDLGPGEINLTIDAGLVPLEPGIDIEKLTNGNQADGVDDADVPEVVPGESVTWTYIVTNTGDVAFDEADVTVVDDTIGPIATIMDQGDGDGVLLPGEVWTYVATGVAENLASPSAGTVVVDGCNPAGTLVPGDRATYENIGTVNVPGDSDSDPSHYCNPLSALGDFVWLDDDRDGVQDDSESGVPGVFVELQDCFGNALASTTTGPDGFYLFDALQPGGYVVVFTAPDGLEFTLQGAGGDDGLDSNADASGVTGCVDLGPGEINLTIDAGLIVPLVPDVDIEKFTKVQPTGGPDGDLCDAYDKPFELTLRYVGGSTLTQDQEGKATVTGNPGSTSPVRIVFSDGGSKVFFDGVVDLGDAFVADADNGGGKFASSSVVTVSDLSGNVLQTVELHTSCSKALNLGDVFGSLQLIGFTDGSGDGAVLPDPDPSDIGEDADVPTGPEASTGDTIVWTYIVTNPGELALADVAVVDDAGTPGDTGDDFAPDPVLDGGVNFGDTDGDGLLDPGEEWRYTATGIAGLGQYGNMSVVTGQPVDVSGTPTGDDDVTADDPSHYFGVFGSDLCDAFEKPAMLTFRYTGDGPDATSSSQDASKVVVVGDPNDAPRVRIVVSDDEDGDGNIFFDGIVDLGEEFTADAGGDKFKSSTHITVYDLSGNVLQRIEFHTSCSQPLFIGDQFGSVRLVGFVDQDGNGPGDVGIGDPVQVTKFELKGKNVKFKLENTGGQAVTIATMDLAWPQATNGGLKKIKQGGKVLFEPSPAAGSPLMVSMWQHADKLTIKPDKALEYQLEFQNDVKNVIGNYSIVLTFSDGSSLAVAP